MSTTTPEANIWMLHNRDSKCAAVIEFLDGVKNDRSWNDTDLVRITANLSDEGWTALAVAAGQNPLSDTSKRLVCERLAGRVG